MSVHRLKLLIQKLRDDRKLLLRRVLGQYVALRNFREDIVSGKARKAIRKAVAIEKREAREFAGLLTNASEISKIIPEPHLTELNKIIEQLKVYNAKTVRELADGGQLDSMKNNIDEYRESLVSIVNTFIQEVSLPFQTTFTKLDALLSKEAKIIEKYMSLNTTDIPMSKEFSKYNDDNPTTILIDTSFLLNVMNKLDSDKKQFLNLHLPDGAIKQFPNEVLEEKSKPIHVRRFIYILRKEGFKAVNFKPTKQEYDAVIEVWEKTNKYNRSDNYQKRNFMNGSADIKLLCMAFRAAKKAGSRIIILSQDGDIYQTIRVGKREFLRKYPQWRSIHCYWYYEREGAQKAA